MPKKKPSPYRKFLLKDVSGTWHSKASRYALSQLTQGQGVAASSAKEVITATQKLMRWRRERLFDLCDASWGLSPTQLVYAGNCPPVGVLTDQSGMHPCQHTRWCPFCWCRRYVVEPFHLFQLLIQSKHREIQHLELVEVRTSRLYDHFAWKLDNLVTWVKESRAVYLRDHLKGHLGAFILCTIEPPELFEDKERQRVRHRILALVPAGARQPPGEAGQVPDAVIQRSVKTTINPDMAALAGALGRIALYPQGMMTGEAAATVEILNATRKVRMSAFYGKLRGLKPDNPEIAPQPEMIRD